jgi:diguanylate cyclase (GGDEF)-like protein/putative nucleotidyltransferase with HDIG domain
VGIFAMQELSVRARVFIITTILVGLVLLTWSLYQIELENTWMLLVLIAGASISLILKVEGATERSHYNISFLFYAFTFVLFGPYETVLVILVSNVVDWAWHKYQWYIQLFNICTYIIAILAAGIVMRGINPDLQLYGLTGVIAILAAMVVFTLANHLMIGVAIWLARGESFSTSGVFDFFPLMLDFTLFGMGAVSAIIWLANPYAMIMALLPLYLIFSTLRVPALERQSELDPKTGLFNAKYFDRALQNELTRANRFDRPLTIVMADLDLLRNINNTYGHLAGDEVLIGVANILKDAVREYDVVVRFGGEEYAILMPETAPEDAFSRIEAIRESIEKTEFNVATSVTPIKVTMSFGIAGRSGFDQMPSDIVHNADAALYYAKLKGRNSTYLYSEEGFIGLREELDPSGLPASQSPERPARSMPVLQTAELTQPAFSPRTAKQPEEIEPKAQPVAGAIPRSRWNVNAFIAATTLVAIFMLSLAEMPFIEMDWWSLGFFVLMVILTEWLSLDIYARNTAVSTSAAPILAGALLFGPPGALLLSLTFAAVAMLKYKSPVSRFFFNFSNQLIALMSCLIILQLAEVAFTILDPVSQLLLSLAFMGLVYIITTGLISLGMSLDFEQPAREIWIERYSWLAPYYFAMGLIADALVFSYIYAGLFGTVVVLVPLLLLRLSQAQFIDRTKFMVNELRSKNVALENSAQEIHRLNDSLLDMLAEVVDLRDPHVFGHSKQVAHYAVLIATRLGLPPKQIELVRKAGLLHDIGKLGIAETILFKPDKLDFDEYQQVKEHAQIGAELLRTSNSLNPLIPIIRYHHEYFNGNGYPEGLSGNEIPLEARIIAVADAIEAMASDRPYRQGMTHEEIIDELRQNAGTQFDPMVVNAFVEIARLDGQSVITNAARKSTASSTPAVG